MIRSGICNSAKLEFLKGIHRPGHVYRVALFRKGSPLDKTVTNFGPELIDYEIDGRGYTPGGKPLLGLSYGLEEDTAFITFDNVIWPSATIEARGCLIYNDSLPGRPAIAVVNFGRDVKSDKGAFTLAVPKASATTAIIRLS